MRSFAFLTFYKKETFKSQNEADFSSLSLSFENKDHQDDVINEDQLADVPKIIPFADREISSQEGDSGIDIPNVINLYKLKPQSIISSKRSFCLSASDILKLNLML